MTIKDTKNSESNNSFYAHFWRRKKLEGLVPQSFHEENLGVVKKNLENEKFMAAALHCEFWYLKYTNICQYSSKHGSGRHIFYKGNLRQN